MARCIPSAYKHTQSVAASTWSITHNLSGNGTQGFPAVDVFINSAQGSLQKTMPLSISRINENQIEIQFSVPQSGIAIIVV
jgi:hypothetical protein